MQTVLDYLQTPCKHNWIIKMAVIIIHSCYITLSYTQAYTQSAYNETLRLKAAATYSTCAQASTITLLRSLMLSTKQEGISDLTLKDPRV